MKHCLTFTHWLRAFNLFFYLSLDFFFFKISAGFFCLNLTNAKVIVILLHVVDNIKDKTICECKNKRKKDFWLHFVSGMCKCWLCKNPIAQEQEKKIFFFWRNRCEFMFAASGCSKFKVKTSPREMARNKCAWWKVCHSWEWTNKESFFVFLYIANDWKWQKQTKLVFFLKKSFLFGARKKREEWIVRFYRNLLY